MIALLQRVLSASVSVDKQIISTIEQGLLVFLGVENKDSMAEVVRLAERVCNYRIFSDSEDKMNLNVQQIKGQILVVPQFTLAANTDKGNRPSFHQAAPPELAREYYVAFHQRIEKYLGAVSLGQFGADMKVTLVNDGPVTFQLTNRSQH